MKNKFRLLFLIVCVFLSFQAVFADESAPVESSLQASESTSPIPCWQDVMREYLIKYGNCVSEEERDAILASRAIDPEKPMVALTFDDGPVSGVTDLILDILEEYNVRATFFIMGCRLKKEANAAILPRMLALGCEIGNHTYNHERLKNLSTKYQLNTCKRVNEAVFELTGFTPLSLRPPGGMTGNTVIKTAEKGGMAIILWSQSGDVRKKDPEAIANNVFTQTENGRALQNGDIILLHDTKKYMVDAVRILVPRLLSEGYQLVTVQELLSYCNIGYLPGYQYKSTEDYRTYD